MQVQLFRPQLKVAGEVKEVEDVTVTLNGTPETTTGGIVKVWAWVEGTNKKKPTSKASGINR